MSDELDDTLNLVEAVCDMLERRADAGDEDAEMILYRFEQAITVSPIRPRRVARRKTLNRRPQQQRKTRPRRR